jgi:hypothetical protein
MTQRNVSKDGKTYQRVPDYSMDYDYVYRKPVQAPAQSIPNYLWYQDNFVIHVDEFEGANGVHTDVPLNIAIIPGEGEEDPPTISTNYDLVLNDYWIVCDYYRHEE